jgi:hypothetical protein
LTAGRLHGFSADVLLNVFENPEAAAANKPIGTLKLNTVKEFESEGEFVEFDETKQEFVRSSPPTTSLTTAVASLLANAAPTGQTRIKILRADAPGDEPVAVDVKSLPTGLATELTQLSESRKISFVADNPDLVLKVSGNAASLFPASGIALATSPPESATPEFIRSGWGPFDAQGKDPEGAGIGDYIDRIVKDKVHSDFEVGYQLLKAEVNDDGKIVSTEVIEPASDKRVLLEVGTAYVVKFTNSAKSKGPLYFTALEVTPNMGIQVVAPYMEKEIKLFPGESYVSDPFEADTAGELYEILLATQEPHDFAFVEQDSLPQTRGSTDMGDLQGELTEALFPNAAKTRGSRVQRKKAVEPVWLTRVIQWEALPEELLNRTLQANLP